MITIQLSTQKWDIASALIRWFTWSDFSHVDIVITSAVEEVLIGSRLSGGVKVRPSNYAKFSKTKRLSVELSYESETELYQFLFKQLHKPYDWRAILNFAFHRRRNWKEDDSWFCSELVAAAFDNVRHPLLNIAENDRVTPRDVEVSLMFKMKEVKNGTEVAR
jgi:uncharacterized protein YycO